MWKDYELWIRRADNIADAMAAMDDAALALRIERNAQLNGRRPPFTLVREPQCSIVHCDGVKRYFITMRIRTGPPESDPMYARRFFRNQLPPLVTQVQP